MQLKFSRFIEGDLDEIADFIAQDNPRRAVTFIKKIRSKFTEIQNSSLAYQLRPDIGDEARISTVGNYAILFRVMGDSVRIERVVWKSGLAKHSLNRHNRTEGSAPFILKRSERVAPPASRRVPHRHGLPCQSAVVH